MKTLEQKIREIARKDEIIRKQLIYEIENQEDVADFSYMHKLINDLQELYAKYEKLEEENE